MEISKLAELFFKFRYAALALMGGLVLLGGGILIAKGNSFSSTKVEVLEATKGGTVAGSQIVVEIAGEIEKPGVYSLPPGSRIEDLLVLAGGLGQNADRSWVGKTLNRAGKLSDGQKVYIPNFKQSQGVSANQNVGYQTTSSNFLGQGGGLVDINTATLKELDSLPGIGPTYAQNIIDHRPYSETSELLSRGVLKKTVYDKIKNAIAIY